MLDSQICGRKNSINAALTRRTEQRKLIANMKTDNLIVEKALEPFKRSLGDSMPKIVGDIKSLLGRVDKDVIVKDGDWKASAGFKLSRRNGETVQLPANNPATILLCFGMRFTELAKNADCNIEAGIPSQCEAWVKEHKLQPKDKVAA